MAVSRLALVVATFLRELYGRSETYDILSQMYSPTDMPMLRDGPTYTDVGLPKGVPTSNGPGWGDLSYVSNRIQESVRLDKML